MSTLVPASATPTPTPASGHSAGGAGAGRTDLASAAKAFEAIFVRQMLATARRADFGDGLFSSQAMDTFRQMQDERFAEIAANTGAFGLARVIETHLARLAPESVTPASLAPDAPATESREPV